MLYVPAGGCVVVGAKSAFICSSSHIHEKESVLLRSLDPGFPIMKQEDAPI